METLLHILTWKLGHGSISPDMSAFFFFLCFPKKVIVIFSPQPPHGFRMQGQPRRAVKTIPVWEHLSMGWRVIMRAGQVEKMSKEEIEDSPLSVCACVCACVVLSDKRGRGMMWGRSSVFIPGLRFFESHCIVSSSQCFWLCFTKVVSTNKDRLSLDNHFYWMEKRNKMKMLCVNFIITCMYLLLSAVSSEVNAS